MCNCIALIFVHQIFSGKHFTLISTFTPFQHPIKPLVEIFFKKLVFQTFRELRLPSKQAFIKHFFKIFLNNIVNTLIIKLFKTIDAGVNFINMLTLSYYVHKCSGTQNTISSTHLPSISFTTLRLKHTQLLHCMLYTICQNSCINLLIQKLLIK